jgi:PQQ-dependent catabolism-associated beta-propeller protein
MATPSTSSIERLLARNLASRRRLQRRMRAWSLVLLGCCAVGIVQCRESPSRSSPKFSIGFVDDGSDAARSARAGVQLGIDEASSAGRLLGRTVSLEVVETRDAAGITNAARALIDRGVFAIVGGFDESACDSISGLATRNNVLFVNVSCRSDALRRAGHPNTFHVEASDSVYFAALTSGGTGGGRAPVIWHEALQRYGAAQLNQRFIRSTGVPADAARWAGWMAAKVLWQIARDINSTDAPTLARHLESDTAEFDGHKGIALVFDSVTHELVQPLYPVPSVMQGIPVSQVSMRTMPAAESQALIAAWKRRATLVLVTNEESRDVTVIDLGTRSVLATIPVQYRPRGVQVSPDGRWAYVATSDDTPDHASDADAIVSIDLRDGTIVSRHRAGSDPEQFAITPDGALLVASNEDAGTATITDLVSGLPVATLTVGIEPEGVAVSPDGRWIYVTAETSNTVSVIDVAKRDVVANFLVEERPRAAVFAPDSKRAYVTNEISGTVSVIDVARHRVLRTIRLADPRAKPVGVAVSADGRRVYVANGHAGSVSIIDAITMQELGAVQTGKRPWGVAIDRSGKWLISANGTSNSVSFIDIATRQVTATIPVGERPWGVALSR